MHPWEGPGAEGNGVLLSLRFICSEHVLVTPSSMPGTHLVLSN